MSIAGAIALGFGIGIIVGGSAGLVIAALCVAAARGDEKTEAEESIIRAEDFNDFSRRRADDGAGRVEFPQRRGREKKAAEGTGSQERQDREGCI